jgi:hypothetical protein
MSEGTTSWKSILKAAGEAVLKGGAEFAKEQTKVGKLCTTIAEEFKNRLQGIDPAQRDKIHREFMAAAVKEIQETLEEVGAGQYQAQVAAELLKESALRLEAGQDEMKAMLEEVLRRLPAPGSAGRHETTPQIQGTPRVFISSTCEDLKDSGHRAAARDAALNADFQPVMMEYWAAQGNPPLNVCLEKVRQTDVHVAIVAHRFGWAPPDQPGSPGEGPSRVNSAHAEPNAGRSAGASRSPGGRIARPREGEAPRLRRDLVGETYRPAEPLKDPAKRKSITWLECDEALARGHELLVFVVDDKYPWPAELREGAALQAAIEVGSATPEMFADVQ